MSKNKEYERTHVRIHLGELDKVREYIYQVTGEVLSRSKVIDRLVDVGWKNRRELEWKS